MEAGRHETLWTGITDGGNAVSSGIYFCRLVSGTTVQTKKLILLR